MDKGTTSSWILGPRFNIVVRRLKSGDFQGEPRTFRSGGNWLLRKAEYLFAADRVTKKLRESDCREPALRTKLVPGRTHLALSASRTSRIKHASMASSLVTQRSTLFRQSLGRQLQARTGDFHALRGICTLRERIYTPGSRLHTFRSELTGSGRGFARPRADLHGREVVCTRFGAN